MKGVKIDFNFVPMPSEIWDDGIELSLSEFRLLGYLIRRQVRFGVAVTAFTRDDLMNGPMRDGRRLDGGCKLSKNSLNSAIESLVARGWIQVDDASNHPKLSQLRISVVMSKVDSDRQNVTIGSSDVDDSLNRVERERVERTTTPPVGDGKDSTSSEEKDSPRDRVRRVFAHYLEKLGRRPTQYELSPKRMKVGLARLEECKRKCGGDYDKAERLMCVVVDELSESEFHTGKNDAKRNYIDWIDHLFKSTEKLDWWLDKLGVA